MAEHDDAQKTEDPTQRRRDEAREKGQVAVSQEVKSWAILLASALGLVFVVPHAARGLTATARLFLEQPHALSLEAGELQGALLRLTLAVAADLAPLLGLLFVAGIAAGFAQVGPLWAPSKVAFDPKKISLINGFQRLFSLRALVEFGKGLVKITAVGGVAIGLALPLVEDLELTAAMSVGGILERMDDIVLRMLAATAAFMTAVALLDYLYQRLHMLREMRMTRQEVRDEYRQAEGDPHVRARIRRLRAERTKKRMMAAVPDADVVITNPTHVAVALAYKMATMAAPKVVAKGVDHMALTIRKIAEQHGVPLVENPPLARALHGAVDIDEEIPAEHYQAVAQVIRYVMDLKGDPKGRRPEG